MSDLRIRPARLDEQLIVEDLLREASAWLASRGINQWQYPPHSDRIKTGLQRGSVYIAYVDEIPVATLQVDDFADPEFWTAGDAPQSALYVHRMAVSRKYAGSGIGSKMLDWVTTKAASHGKKWVRLDAWKTNVDLHRYYINTGFTHVRTVDLPHRGSGALFQRAAKLQR